MRNILLTLCVVVMMLPGLPTVAAQQEHVEARYIGPSHGATLCPTGITNLEPVCIGGAIVRSPSGDVYTHGSAKVIDDVFGEYVAYTMCVGDDDNLQGCTPGAFVCGPGSVATDQADIPHSTINVFILSFFVPENGGEPCFATSGVASITFGQ